MTKLKRVDEEDLKEGQQYIYEVEGCLWLTLVDIDRCAKEKIIDFGDFQEAKLKHLPGQFYGPIELEE